MAAAITDLERRIAAGSEDGRRRRILTSDLKGLFFPVFRVELGIVVLIEQQELPYSGCEAEILRQLLHPA